MAGCSLGLALGGVYLASGLGAAAAAHQKAEAAMPSDGVLQYVAADDAVVYALDGAPSLSFPFLRGLQQAKATQPAPLAPAVDTPRRDIDCLTQAVYYEARGEGARGQAAVAQVVMNRVKNPRFPKTVCGVVFQGASSRGCQFSFACDGSIGRRKEKAAWDSARRIAARALVGAVAPDVGSATHFHTTAVSPDWAPRMMKVAQVGLHVFYRFSPRGRPAVSPAEPAMPADDALVFVSAPAATPAALHLTPAITTEPAQAPAEAAKAKPAAPAEPRASVQPTPETVTLSAGKPAAKAVDALAS